MLPFDMRLFLEELGFIVAPTSAKPLAGGVSSDIWRVDIGGRSLCVKRALPELRVAADWRVPVERSDYEFAWLTEAGQIAPRSIPKLLGRSVAGHMFAMEFLSPDDYPVWKRLLFNGVIDVAFATAVGDALGRVHAGTAHRSDIAARFATDDLFFALRLDPYFNAAAVRNPDLKFAIDDVVQRTARAKLTLVHGDVSPKNILSGPEGPIFLDAECAWFGDPAFDVAFCLNHLLLKAFVNQGSRELFDALLAGYTPHIAWEPLEQIMFRIVRLLPALLLARVDGKSPVEYLSDGQISTVRTTARSMISQAPETMSDLSSNWYGVVAP